MLELNLVMLADGKSPTFILNFILILVNILNK